MRTRMGSHTFTGSTQFFTAGQTWFPYHHYSLPEAQAKLHLPAAAKSHQPTPEGRSPSRPPRHRQTVPAYRTDYWSLERNVLFAVLPPELGIHLIQEPQANPFSSLGEV